MATYMIDSITVTRAKVYKGAARLVISDPDTLTSFPGVLESVMNPAVPADGGTAYALADGWSDLGPTTEDGVTIRREAELDDGIPVDQRNTNLDEGEPDKWTMELEASLLNTDLYNFNYTWEAGTKRTIAATGTNVAQHSLDLDAPASFTERMMAVIQEDPSSTQLRCWVFRQAIPQVSSETVVQKGEATNLPVTFKLKADETVSEGSGQFGKIFEEDA
jgi:hypothetical protein